MTRPLADRHRSAVLRFRRQVLATLQQAHTEPENGWMDAMQVLQALGHGTPGEVRRAFEGLVESGLAETEGHLCRSRGVTAARVFDPYVEAPEEALRAFADRQQGDRAACAADIWFIAQALSADGYTPLHAVAELIKRGWTPPEAGTRSWP